MDLHFILHIPKTGGQTIRDHLRAHLELHSEFVHIGPFGNKHAEKNGLTPWEARSDAERARVRVLAGHDLTTQTLELVPGDRTVKLAGMFRDPAARIVSAYNFNVETMWGKHGKPVPDFASWYGERRQNTVSHLIRKFLARPTGKPITDEDLFDEVAAALDQFWLLGTMTHFDDFVTRLYADIGVPMPTQHRSNVGGRDHPVRLALNAEIEEQVRRDHPVDYAIYNLVQQRVDAALKAQPATNA